MAVSLISKIYCFWPRSAVYPGRAYALLLAAWRGVEGGRGCALGREAAAEASWGPLISKMGCFWRYASLISKVYCFWPRSAVYPGRAYALLLAVAAPPPRTGSPSSATFIASGGMPCFWPLLWSLI